MSIESLSNKGVVILRPQSEESDKTLIVVGVARGGTSIVAGCLHHLGVAMEGAKDPVYEDLRLSLAFEKQSKEKFKDVVRDYNNKHQVWAWKRPSTLNSLSYIARNVRNPHFIFVFRDMLSVANRNALSMHKDIAWGLLQSQNDYKKIIKFINRTKCPSLLVSSEKVVKYKNDFIQALTDFSGIECSEENISSALNFITPNPTKYLASTRLTRAKGQIDLSKLRTGILKGWACYAVNHGEVNIEVVVNNEIIETLIANRFEPEYKKPGIHPTGECGFQLDLKSYNVKPSDNLEVRVKGDVVNIHTDKLDCGEGDQWVLHTEDLNQLVPRGRLNIELVQAGIVRGWARTKDAEVPARIGIYINGAIFAEVPATIYRKNLDREEIHPTGQCGFEFDLKLHGVKPQDDIVVKVLNAEVKLHSHTISHPSMTQWLTQEELKKKN